MSAVIAIRVDDATKARLKAMGERNGMTEGQVVKYLVDTGLSGDPEGAVLNQAVWKLSAGLNRGMAAVLARLREILEEELQLPAEDLGAAPEGEEFEEPTPVIGGGNRKRRGRRGGRS